MASLINQDKTRKLLKLELEKRCQVNNNYSLRAFARFLEIDPSYLSKILKGKRNVTPFYLNNFISKLEIGPEFTDWLKLDSEKVVHPAEEKFFSIEADHFAVISNWYHYAIFELLDLTYFHFSETNIARYLKISVPEVQGALERLQRLKFIGKEEETGKCIKLVKNITTIDNNFTNSAFRKYQKTILEKAVKALDDVEFKFRDQSSLTFSLNADEFDKVKDVIKNFRREVNHIADKSKNKDSVYQLSVSLFPLTTKRSPKWSE